MSSTFLVTTATHWLGFLAFAGWLGSLALDCLVLPANLPDVARAGARLRRWRALCLIVLVITTAGELVIRAQTMAGGGILSAIDATPTVLVKTKFGNLWIARFLMLTLALLMTRAEARPARMMTLTLALGIALTTSLTGHAGDWGDVSWSVGLDWVHVVATATWTGGLISLTFVAFERAVAWPEGILRVTARRFSRLAGWCLLAVVVSGGYSAWIQVRQVSSMWTTPYGRVLTIKLLVVLALASCGAVNRYVILPLLLGGRAGRLARVLGPSRYTASTTPSRFRTYVGIEALLAVVVFGGTAVLIDTTPARHVRHPQHNPEMDRPPHAEALPTHQDAQLRGRDDAQAARRHRRVSKVAHRGGDVARGRFDERRHGAGQAHEDEIVVAAASMRGRDVRSEARSRRGTTGGCPA